MTKWYQKTPAEVARLLDSDLYGGLSQREAEKRSLEKRNQLFGRRQQSSLLYGKSFLSALLPLLLLITAVALLLSDETVAGLVLLVSCVLSSFFIFAAYAKARSIMETAERDADPSCRVIRDGKLFLIPCEELALGDVILLEKGDFVPADCLLITADSLLMRESGVTERKFSRKDAAALYRGENYWEASSVILAGTAVEEGSCRALVCLVGEDTRFYSLLEKKSDGGFEKTPLVATLKKLSAILAGSFLGLLFLATLWGFFPFSQRDFLDNFVLLCAFASSAMTEFYGIFAYIAAGSALYGTALRTKGALVKEAKTLDAISSLDALFVDPDWFKLPLSERLVGVSLPFSEGMEALRESSPLAKQLLRDGALAFGEWYGAMPLQGAQSGKDLHDDLATCVREALREVSLPKEGADYPLIACGKTQAGLRYGMILRGDTLIVTLLGQAKAVLPLCAYSYYNGKLKPLEEADRTLVTKRGETLANASPEAFRTVYAVGVGVLEALPPSGIISDDFLSEKLYGNLALEGFLVVEETLHPASLSALGAAKQAGLSVLCFCEDENEASLAETVGFAPETIVKGATRKEKYDLLLAAKAEGKTVGFAGRDFSTLAHMHKADVALSLLKWQREGEHTEIVAGDEEGRVCSRYGCDALRLSSDLAVSYGQKEGYGGFASLFEAILNAKAYGMNMVSLVRYLIFVSAMKLVLTVASLFVAIPFVSALLLTMMGLGFDLLAVFSFVLRRPTVSAGRYSFDLTLFFKSLIPIALSGLLSGVSLFLGALLSKSLPESRELFITPALLAVTLGAFLWCFLSGKGKFRGLGTFVTVGGVLALFFLLTVQASFNTGAWIAFSLSVGIALLLQGVGYLLLRKKRSH